MASTIGIKIANGEFYSILEENSNVKKRLILTTVHDDQKSVQIDLYKSQAESMADALYIGTLVVENINPRPSGDPSVELIIASSADGEITADATDLDASPRAEHQHLTVSLKSLDEDTRKFDDFELEQLEPPPQGLYESAKKIRKERSGRGRFPWIAVIIGAVIILIGLALWFFLFRGNLGSLLPKAGLPVGKPPVSSPAVETPVEPAPPAAAEPVVVPPVQTEPAVVPPAPAPVVEAPRPAPVVEAPRTAPVQPAVRRNRPRAPVFSYKVPATIPPGGVTYTIRWGDTLWDISEAFYRNPWLYTRIARYNNIRNPNRVVSGTTIRIPPKK